MKNCESYVLEKGIRHTFASHFPGLSSHRLTTSQPPFLLLFLLPRNLSLPAHPSHPSHPPTHSSHSGRIVMHHFFLSFFYLKNLNIFHHQSQRQPSATGERVRARAFSPRGVVGGEERTTPVGRLTQPLTTVWLATGRRWKRWEG